MVDLKRTAAEKKAEKAEWDAMPMGGEGDDYPYGLRICLDSDTLEKLKLTPLAVGGRVNFSGFGTVVSARMSESASGKECSMDIQITDLDLSPMDEKSAASALYGDDDADGGL